MRLNKYIALATGLSRRAADGAIASGRVQVNGRAPTTGHQVTAEDTVLFDNRAITPAVNSITIMLNKPAGFVCSRDGQGARTVYELLPPELAVLKSIGRLDKDSRGLLLMTTDGDLAQRLTHPKYQKTKVYEVRLNTALQPLHRQMISDYGIKLQDGVSKLELARLRDGDDTYWQVTMREGRNRQIRRTFESLGYKVTDLYRTHFGGYQLGSLAAGGYQNIQSQ